ncbi:DUF6087 family protein [Streptomyces sp. NPDC091278]|uniref:DUF6087 family protein n=1 Tax=Streptomyces sp. NPDC091278 TaxID=3155301 RepID=UPI00344B4265
MNDEEPLEEWARRREIRRKAATGRRRFVPLGDSPHRGAHVDPGAPRAIEEWTGIEWAVVGVAENLAAVKALLYPRPPRPEKPAESRPAGARLRTRRRARAGRRTGPGCPATRSEPRTPSGERPASASGCTLSGALPGGCCRKTR